MAIFITIGYGDEAGYQRTDQAVRDTAHAHDAQTAAEQSGAMGMAGSPIQVRNHNARGVETTEGPYMTAELPVAGFGVLEAADLEEAIRLAGQTPCAVAYGVVEVWPLQN